MRRVVVGAGCLLLGACGGGGSGGGTAAPPVAAVPTLSVTLTPSATRQTVSDVNSAANLTVQASYSGSTADPVVPVVSFDNNSLAVDGSINTSGNTYAFTLKAAANLAAGTYPTVVTFRLCKETACTTVYPGSTQTFTYTLDVAIADWSTRQRNAAHNGYIHAAFDPAKFARAWEYAPAGATVFREVSSRAGSVFLTQVGSGNIRSVVAVDGVTGAQKWQYSIGNVYEASGPTLVGGRLAISTMSSANYGSSPLITLNADTGQFVTNQIFNSQWSQFAPPTPFGDAVYVASGYYGNVVYAFDTRTGTALWTGNGSRGNTWDGQAPAVDANYVYYYSGNLDVIDRATGRIVKSIADPFWQWNGYSYGGTPMLGSSNHVIAYSGNGQGTYTVAFPLVNYDVTAGAYRWRTARLYNVIPAVASGVVYAASNQFQQFDAIDEATGAVKWSWPVPAGEQFIGNIVVTDTLAFVSTNAAVYAIALDGAHDTKWTVRTPGTLSISPDAKLIVASAAGATPAKVTAYSLR